MKVSPLFFLQNKKKEGDDCFLVTVDVNARAVSVCNSVSLRLRESCQFPWVRRAETNGSGETQMSWCLKSSRVLQAPRW